MFDIGALREIASELVGEGCEMEGTVCHDAADTIEQLSSILNTPVVEPFLHAAIAEAAHQRKRWGDQHDESKDAFDWYWTLGYLSAKAARAHNDKDYTKALHHTVTAAALLAHWHRLIVKARDISQQKKEN
jgi:hypothetical protein